MRKGLFWPRQELLSAKWRGAAHFADKIRHIEGLSHPILWGEGIWEPFASREQRRFLHRRIFHDEPLGLWEVEVFEKGDQGAFFYPKDVYFSPPSLLEAMKQAFLNLGGVFASGVVERLCIQGSVLLEGTGLEAPLVILATGAFTEALCLRSGLPVPPLTYSEGSLWYKTVEEQKPCARIENQDPILSGWGEERRSTSWQGAQERKGTRCKGPKGPLQYELVPGVWVSTGFHKNGYDLAEEYAKKLVEQLKYT
jgi:glycine/D-amino acid oxidase-like deaminating enzyme